MPGTIRRALLAVILAACGHATPKPPSASESTPERASESTASSGPERVGDGGDRDGDGVPDDDDACPCHPEDRDGWEDEDGCPDEDNDGDRLVDACDYCPNEPETYNGFEDVDGCPDAPHVSITSSMRIQIIERIYFRRGSSTIEPHNAPVLDTIAQVMNEQPSIRLVELVGGASQDERHPESLSRRRAEAVMQALIDRGVDPARLRVRAAGTREPVAAPGEPGTAELNRYVVPQLIDVEPSPEPLPQEPAPGPCPGGPPPPTASVCP